LDGNKEQEALDINKLKSSFPERNSEKFAPHTARCLNSRGFRLSSTIEG
jgi:hypothetical protein